MQEENKELFGSEYQENGYVFTKANGSVYHPSYASHELNKKLKRNDLPHIRWHDLRHSTASILLARNWGIKDISEWLGHSNISTTMNIYEHVDMSRKRNLSKGIENMLTI